MTVIILYYNAFVRLHNNSHYTDKMLSDALKTTVINTIDGTFNEV